VTPFLISSSAGNLRSTYPASGTVKAALKSLGRDEKLGFLRLWVSEGIPFAFREIPLIYEMLRGWLGAQLSIHPKVITVIGSARIGFSLCPDSKYGSPFGSHSDLDLAVVEKSLFLQLATDFERWEADYASGVSTPRSPAEQKHWPENKRRVPGNISRGFIDPYKIPARQRYSTARMVLDVKSRLERKISITESAPRFRGISARVYKDWASFLDQMERNLDFTIQSFAKATAQQSK
jgi:hypothetical protein